MPKSGETMAVENADLKNLFGMRRLAIAKAFELSVGREAYDDPAAVQEHLRELVAIRKQQRALLASVMDQQEKRSLSTIRDNGDLTAGKGGRQKKKAKIELIALTLMDEFRGSRLSAPWEGSEKMDAEQQALFAQEGEILYKLATSSGVVRIMTDANELRNLAQSCGMQLSQAQLAVGDTLDNLERGYSIKPISMGDDKIGFTAFGEKRELAAPALGRILTGETDNSVRAMFFQSNVPDFTTDNLASLLAKPLGLKNKMRQATSRTNVNLSVSMIFGQRTQWSQQTLPDLAAMSAELDGLITDAQEGDFVGDLLSLVEPAARDTGSLSTGLLGTRKLTPYFAALHSALLEPMRSLFSEIEAIAATDRQARAMSWFDEMAGHRAADLVAKVWGPHAARGRSFSEIEMVAGNAQNIWAALEGQEALGLFSARAAAGLGLSLSGRDLPERAKAKLKSCGLTDGGWRLLGRLDSAPTSTAADWAVHIGRQATKTLKPDNEANSPENVGEREEIAADWRLIAEMAMRLAGHLGAPQNREKTQQISDGIPKLFAAALSAASAKGAGVEKTQELLAKLFRAPDGFIQLFFAPPEQADIPASDQKAEEDAFHAKAPILLSRLFDKALAEGCARAWPAVELVNDWLSNAEWGIWRDLPDNVSWADANRRQKDWHDMIQRRKRSEKESIAWESLIGPDANPQTGFSSIPLTDGGMLWDEGKAMRHCVSSYAEKCQEGGARIFGILRDGERFATLELGVDADGRWREAQLKGKCNDSIADERALEFTSQIRQKYQAAHDVKMANAAKATPESNNIAEKLANKRSEFGAPAGAARPAEI